RAWRRPCRCARRERSENKRGGRDREGRKWQSRLSAVAAVESGPDSRAAEAELAYGRKAHGRPRYSSGCFDRRFQLDDYFVKKEFRPPHLDPGKGKSQSRIATSP